MIVACDAAQLEWRGCLELCKDETGLREILDGADTHDLNRVAFSLPSRLISKRYLFRTIFRGSGYAFSIDPDFSHVSSDPKYWTEVNEKFYGKYSGIDRQHYLWKDEVMAGRPIVGPLGRAWHIPIGRDKRGELKVPWTTLSNYPVQGTCADIMTIARISAYNRIKKYKLPVDWIQTVHDDIKIDSPEKYVKTVAEIYHEAFNQVVPNIKRIFNYEWTVPLKCEVKVGHNMKEMTPYEV